MLYTNKYEYDKVAAEVSSFKYKAKPILVAVISYTYPLILVLKFFNKVLFLS